VANIKDIAKMAGVSVATVSRALSQPGVVKESTIKKVEAAIRKLDYKPNAMAAGLRRQKSDNIIVVVPNIHNPFYSGVVQGIENIAHGNGYKVLLGETQDNQARLDRYTEMVHRKQADGLILLGSLLPSDVKASLRNGRDASIPLVLACEYFKGLDSPNVQIDNLKAAALAVEHLLKLGHARIAKITGPAGNPLSRDRLNGYKSALKDAKLAFNPKLVVDGDFTVSSGYEAMKNLLKQTPKPTAVFCSNDEMAIGALKAIKEKGLRVPEDISVVGFDNLRFAEYCSPALTTIAQPNVQIGEVAMQLMMDLLDDGPKKTKPIVLPHSLIVRESTARLG
jgi:LacI family transcriptional regulator, repressor for deo operon, udp, cdd, tsx, nupC, and nupG